MRIEDAKAIMLAACDDADRHHPDDRVPGFREAIVALPDRTRLSALGPVIRQQVEGQLVDLLCEDLSEVLSRIAPDARALVEARLGEGLS
jgi:hypothetical protein